MCISYGYYRYTITVKISNSETTEESCTVVDSAEIRIGHHSYRSRFVVADVRHDTILGMPWHSEVLPKVDYKTTTVEIDDIRLFETPENNSKPITVTSMHIKKFENLQNRKYRYLLCT